MFWFLFWCFFCPRLSVADSSVESPSRHFFINVWKFYLILDRPLTLQRTHIPPNLLPRFLTYSSPSSLTFFQMSIASSIQAFVTFLRPVPLDPLRFGTTVCSCERLTPPLMHPPQTQPRASLDKCGLCPCPLCYP